ncbi:MAG: VWA domain-containing protein [Candidatus Acidiferrales bacterium]
MISCRDSTRGQFQNISTLPAAAHGKIPPAFTLSRPFNNARFIFCFALASVSFVVGVRSSALRPRQSRQSAPAAPQAKLKVRVSLVKVDASIVNSRGKFVEGLQKQNFHVFDDGAEQPITFFASTDAPAQVLVLIETSPAVFLIHRQHLDAAYALLNGLGPDDRVALATYSDRSRLVQPFTTDKSALAGALAGIQYNIGSGDLNFYDSVSAALDWLSPISGKKALVLLTTGLDSSPAGHWRSLLEKLRGSEVTIFPVALGGALRSFQGNAPATAGSSAALPPGMSFTAANHALASLADSSGGQAFFPEQDKDFVPIYRRIAAALRHQYTLGFKPPALDGKFHSVRLEIFDSNGRLLPTDGPKHPYRIFARQGYVAPSS